jgi:Zn-dependent protease with chaperone function
MKTFLRVAVIETMRLLSLSSAAMSSFAFAWLSFSLICTPYILFYGPVPWEEWHSFIMILGIAYGPAVLVAYFPGYAAGAFDIRFGGRRLSEREKEVIRKVDEQLKISASESGVKLPQIAWRVQDTGEINAFAYAHNRVCFTKGILHKYSDTQRGIERLAGIAAHEIGHLRNWDTRINMFLHYLSLPVNFGIGLMNNTLSRIPVVGFLSTAVTILLRIPCDIAHLLNEASSQPREYQADRFAAKLMNGVGIGEFLDDISHMDERKGDTFSAWMMRSHPPTELRHDELAKAST